MNARRDLNGLPMVVATLVVVAGVLALVTQRDVEVRREEVRTDGTALANALSRIPIDRLVATDGRVASLLTSMGSARWNTSFAYAAVVDLEGRPLESVTAPGVSLPKLAPPTLDPTTWHAENRLDVEGLARRVREFRAPVLEDGRLIGQVRIAYYEPHWTGLLQESSFHAKLALVVFLLLPVASLWLRSELRPLRTIAEEIGAQGFEGSPNGAARSGADVERLARSIRDFTEELERKSVGMEKQRVALLASSKVLAHQKNRTEVLLESLPDGVLMLDPSGVPVLANARATSILRLARENLEGASVADWSPAPEVTRMVQRYAGGRGNPRRADRVEFSPGEADRRRFVASIHPLPEDAGFAIVLRDVSEEHSAREAQSEFLGHMAHELKAPLNVISMYRESVLEEGEEAAVRVEACNVIADEVDRLNGLINNIFSISRIEGGAVTLERQRIRIRDLLVDVFESTAREGAEQGLAFELEVPDTMDAVHADKQLLSIAVKNLLTNAIKYNRPEGTVTLHAEQHEDGLSIDVRDTGIGIPSDEVDLVFEKFFRSESDEARKIGGHGLGLALVKDIVALHGGEIRVQSELGEGSTFTLFFGRHSAVFREES